MSKSEAYGKRLPSGHADFVLGGGLGAGGFGIHRGFYPVHDIIIYAVFDVRKIILTIEKFALVGVVLGKQQLRAFFAVKPATTIIVMVELDRCDLRRYVLSQSWFAFVQSPRPGIAEPKGGQQMYFGVFRTAVECLDPDQNIVRLGLGVFH